MLFFVVMMPTATAAACIAVFMVMLFSAATARMLFLVMRAAGTLVIMIGMVMTTATTTATVAVFMVMLFTAATTRVFFFVMRTAGALLIMVVTTAATTTTVGVFMVMLFTVATARMFFFVMRTAGTPVIMIGVIVTAATATASTTTFMSLAFNTDRTEFSLGLLDFKTDHRQHFADIGQSQNGKTVFSLSNVNATVNQSADGFVQDTKIPGHPDDFFDCRANHPKSTVFIKKNIINIERTGFFHRNVERSFGSFNTARPVFALFRRQHQLMGAIENGLGWLRFGCEKLGKSRHFEFLIGCRQRLSGVCIRQSKTIF